MHIISDADKTEFINIETHHVDKLKIIKNSHGEHFDDCEWSNEYITCSNDTFPCIYYKHRRYPVENKAKNIINFYNLAKCKNGVFNIF